MAVATSIPGASGLLSLTTGSFCRYLGFCIRETAGTTATVRIREGSVTGKILDDIQLLANESARDWYGPQGIISQGDLYVQLVSGTVEGSVRSE